MKKWCREPGQPPSLSPSSVLTVLAGVLNAVSLTNCFFRHRARAQRGLVTCPRSHSQEEFSWRDDYKAGHAESGAQGAVLETRPSPHPDSAKCSFSLLLHMERLPLVCPPLPPGKPRCLGSTPGF